MNDRLEAIRSEKQRQGLSDTQLADMCDLSHSTVSRAFSGKTEPSEYTLNAMESALPEDGTLRMEITLICETGKPREKPRLKIGLRVGEERLYVVRSIPQLIEAVDSRTSIEFGKGFMYQPKAAGATVTW